MCSVHHLKAIKRCQVFNDYYYRDILAGRMIAEESLLDGKKGAALQQLVCHSVYSDIKMCQDEMYL